MFNKILVCLDGSSLAEQLLLYAKAEAVSFKSKIVLLKVMTIANIAVKAEAEAPAQIKEVIDETIEQEESEAKNYLEGVARPLLKQGMIVECVVLKPSPVGEAIVNYSINNDIDLICIATRTHSGLGRVVLGSITDYVLKNSDIPLLVIKPDKTKEK